MTREKRHHRQHPFFFFFFFWFFPRQIFYFTTSDTEASPHEKMHKEHTDAPEMVFVRRRLQLVSGKMRDERVKARVTHLLRKGEWGAENLVSNSALRSRRPFRQWGQKQREQKNTGKEKPRTLTATASEASTAVDAIAMLRYANTLSRMHDESKV